MLLFLNITTALINPFALAATDGLVSVLVSVRFEIRCAFVRADALDPEGKSLPLQDADCGALKCVDARRD